MPPRNEAFTLTDAALPPKARLRGHCHASAHLCVVLAGAFEERTPRGSAWCPSGHARYSSAGDVHDLTASPSGARCLIVALGRTEPFPSIRRYFRAVQLGHLLPLLLELSRHPEAVSPLETELLLLELFALGAHGGPPADGGWPERVRERLRATPLHPPSLTELATSSGLHPVSLARGFRRRFGCSIGQYTRRLRADAARRWLLSGLAGISEVAAQCGYADQSHLTRELRRQLGVTPAALRRTVPSVQDRPARSS